MTIGKQYLIPAATLVVGLVLGAAVGTSEAPEPESAPTVTVTATPEPAPTVTITETPEAVTNPACLDALEAAESIIDVSGDLASLVSRHLGEEQEAWTEVADGNWGYLPTYTDQMQDFTSEVRDLTARVDVANYAALKAACLG